MNPRRHSSIRRLLALFGALAALIIVVSVLPQALLDWERTCDSHEREIISGYQFARALIQERLAAARLLAEQAAQKPDPTQGVPQGVTILVIAPDGKPLASSGGRTLPRLAQLGDRLAAGPQSGVEIDDQGRLLACASIAHGGVIVVAGVPFRVDDAEAIKQATGLESSFFAGQARVATTLRDPHGQPATAVPMPQAEWEALLSSSGQLRWTRDPGLGVDPFLEIQVPLYGLDGSLVGAYAIGSPWADRWAVLQQRALFWLGALVLYLILLALVTLWLSWRLLGPLARLQRHLEAVAAGSGPGPPLPDTGLAELDRVGEQLNQLNASHLALLRSSERLNEQLTQSRTLAALGQLAAGVAHDLNNPLTTIMGLAEILQTANLDPETRRDLGVIRRQAERSARIVRGLLGFARRQGAEPQWVSLNDLIRQTLDLLAYQARVSSIRFETRLHEDLPLTWADPSQMQQVLFNLVNNAIQAMAAAHGRGNLLVESSCTSSTPGAPHGRITIRVQDDGPGLPPEVFPRLFQPYFTTKGPDKGTGLGLAIAAGIVRRHSGRIWAENRPEGGACFSVELPVTPEPPQGEAAGAGDRLCSILLADSDPQQVSALARMLRRQGYLLATAGDGLLARNKMEMEAFDLILCGLEMSRLSGRELYAWARAHQPAAADRFIFIARGEPGGEAELFLQTCRAPCLRPPFQDEVVQATIRQALSGQVPQRSGDGRKGTGPQPNPRR